MEDTNTRQKADRVRAVLSAGDRRRRIQRAGERAWAAAPPLAAIALAVSAIGRFAGWPAAVPFVLMAAGLLVWVAWLALSTRTRPVSDVAASRLDADAALGGELRSAGWFAAQPVRDEWADLHVALAAERLARIDWLRVYPPVRAPRARAATAVLLFATLALTVVLPPRTSSRATNASDQAAPGPHAPPPPDALPPELQKQLEALLAAAESGALDEGRPPSSLLSAAQMRDLIGRLQQVSDRETLKDLAESMARLSGDPDLRGADALKRLSDRAKQAANATRASREARTALEELARKLSEAAAAEEAAGAAAAAEIEDRVATGGDAAASAKADDAAVQAVSEAPGAAEGAGTIMMSGDASRGGTAAPGFGMGGASGAAGADGTAAGLSEALRQELVEASKDTAGTNVQTEVRRRTEQGAAAVSFTHGAAARSDRTRAGAPERVPETRHSEIRRYFTRKPQEPRR